MIVLTEKIEPAPYQISFQEMRGFNEEKSHT
jgi:hypothetical protein